MDWKKTLFVAMVALAVIAPRADAGTWMFDANAGVGVPSGDFGDFWSSGLLVGGALDYFNAPFAIGIDASWLKNNPSDDYEAVLGAFGTEGDNRFLQYGVHAKWMAPSQSSVAPYVGLGVGMYSIKEKYEGGTAPGELSDTVFGVHGGAGMNYWINPSWGLGLDASYHNAFTNEEDFGYSSAPYFAISGGIRWKMSRSN